MDNLPFEFPKTESRYVDRARRAAEVMRRRFGPEVPASDLVHQVILDALSEHARTGAVAKGFWRRLTNKVFDEYRRGKAHRRMIERKGARWQAALDGSPGPGEELVGQELHAEIERAVAGLSPNDREIWRRLARSESYVEIGLALGRSPGAIKQAAYRIRAHVRNVLPSEYKTDAGHDR